MKRKNLDRDARIVRDVAFGKTSPERIPSTTLLIVPISCPLRVDGRRND